MALLFAEGFDGFSDSGNLLSLENLNRVMESGIKVASNATNGLTNSGQIAFVSSDENVLRSGESGKFLRVNSSNLTHSSRTGTALQIDIDSKDKVGIGYDFFMSMVHNNNRGLWLRAMSESGNTLLQVRVSDLLQIVVTSGDYVAVSDMSVIDASTWYRVELFIDSNAGTYELRLNGDTILSDTYEKSGEEVSHLLFHHQSGQSSSLWWGINNLVVWDDAGDYLNDFPGQVEVKNILPSGVVSNNWQVVDAADALEAMSKEEYHTPGTLVGDLGEVVEVSFDDIQQDTEVLAVVPSVWVDKPQVGPARVEVEYGDESQTVALSKEVNLLQLSPRKPPEEGLSTETFKLKRVVLDS